MITGFNLSIFNQPGGIAKADWSGRFRGGVFSTGPHGDLELTGFIHMPAYEAFGFYDQAKVPHVELSWQGTVIWEGRLEDVSLVEEGIEIKALGYWAAMYDIPYAALWSDTRFAGWRPVNTQDMSVRIPDRYEIDTNNRLYIAPRKGETYTNGTDVGALTYAIPHNSTRNIVGFSCDYSMTLPAGWRFNINRMSDTFTGVANVNSLAATGALQSGTLNLTFTGSPRLTIDIFNLSGAASTIAADTGVYFLRLTNIRVKTILTSVFVNEIISDLITSIRALNPNMLSPVTANLENPVHDLDDALYEDVYPGDLANYLASLGDVLQNAHEVGVGPGRVLYFRRKGRRVLSWHIDLQEQIKIERTLSGLVNSAYAVFRGTGGRTLRSAVQTDAESVRRYGITRRQSLGTEQTNSTKAGAIADLYLEDQAQENVRAAIEINRALTSRGAERADYWSIRAGDIVTIRNLPPFLIRDLDKVTTFTVEETRFDLDTGILTLIPEGKVELLETYLARAAAGVISKSLAESERKR